MTEYRKKLIEVALPLKAINVASAKEKSIRHGHPSTLHLWWARRPLAACRAVLFASLVNDPSDDPMYGVSEEIAASERAKLFNLIEELVLWENSNNPRVINAARAEIARSIAANKVADGEWKNDQAVVTAEGKAASAHDFKHKLATTVQVNAFLAEHAPPVLDPFCGGGSIPLEAQRLGLRVYASDLNPIPVLITKALVEIPPKFAGRQPVNPEWQAKSAEQKASIVWHGAQGLAEDVRFYGQWMRDEAEKRIGHLYPTIKVTAEMAKDRPDLSEYINRDLTVIAWIWARTVPSPNPAVQGAPVPLVRTFWLSSKEGAEAWVEPVLDASKTSFRFVVRVGKPSESHDPGASTIGRSGGKCLLTDAPMSLNHVRTEARAHRLSQRLMATIAERNGRRLFLSPRDEDEALAGETRTSWRPEGEMPKKHRDIHPPSYGLDTFGQLFNSRPLVALNTFIDLLHDVHAHIQRHALPNLGSREAHDYADSLVTYLSFAIGKGADYWSTVATWESGSGFVRNTFPKPGIPMTWDYCETNPLGEFSGNWMGAIDWIVRVIRNSPQGIPAVVVQRDAVHCDDVTEDVVYCTDPPYYDNISYAELSDYFYVWLRRALSPFRPQLFATMLSPKTQELVAAPHRHGGNKTGAQAFFENGLAECFKAMRKRQISEFPMSVFYAFKQSEADDGEQSSNATSTGWETMLEGMNSSGFSVLGTWPVRTERTARSMSIGKNALASSIVLVCRPRHSEARLATRKEFITALRSELPQALRNLQQGNIAPVDLAQAAIGPGMAVFTRYSKVIESAGTPMTVRTALGTINQVLDEVLAEQEGEFDADTRWALAWFEQFGMQEESFGVAETLSKAKNTAVNGLVEAGIIKAKSGKVQLVSRAELPDNWDPATDKRLTAWETVQHLIGILETKGEAEAAKLLNRLGGLGETARDLSYRLYSICERKKWADEALAYNSLVIAWPELSKLAIATRNRQPSTQQDLFS